MNTTYVEREYQGVYQLTLEANAFDNFEIYFFDEVNKQSLQALHMQLLKLNSKDPNKEITIYIDSPGGEVYSGLVMLDILDSISNPIRTVCMGMAASMAAVLFAYGDKREIYAHSQVMIHDPLIQQMGGNALAVSQIAEKLMNMRDTIANILAAKTGKTKEEILEVTKQDHYLSASEAVEFGIADSIIGK